MNNAAQTTPDGPRTDGRASPTLRDAMPESGRRGPVVAIDGPASSGKSSVGAAAAAELGLRFCDTGLLYRAATWLAARRGIAPAAAAAVAALADEIRLEADPSGRLIRVVIAGEDVTDAVRSPEVDAAVSPYAAVPELRAALLRRQRAIAADGAVVMAGRDIGTVVLPDADVKIYLDASAEERAKRRADERGLASDSPDRAAILDALLQRDGIDSGRAVAPLRAADDAVIVRTDGRSFEATVAFVVAAIQAESARLALAADPPGSAGKPAGRVPRPARPARPNRRPIEPTAIAGRMNPLIRLMGVVARTLARLLAHVVIEGDVSAIPRTGSLIVVGNHASSADPVLVGAFLNGVLDRPLNWLGKREVFEMPLLGWIARRGGVHPVDREAADIEAFRTASRILEAGHILAVFPEGTRSRTGALAEAQHGIALLALRTGAPVLPVGVEDADVLWPRGSSLPRPRPRVVVRIGTPFRVAETLGGVDGRRAGRRIPKEEATRLIMGRIAALLPERQRGFYADAAVGQPGVSGSGPAAASPEGPAAASPEGPAAP